MWVDVGLYVFWVRCCLILDVGDGMARGSDVVMVGCMAVTFFFSVCTTVQLTILLTSLQASCWYDNTSMTDSCRETECGCIKLAIS